MPLVKVLPDLLSPASTGGGGGLAPPGCVNALRSLLGLYASYRDHLCLCIATATPTLRPRVFLCQQIGAGWGGHAVSAVPLGCVRPFPAAGGTDPFCCFVTHIPRTVQEPAIPPRFGSFVGSRGAVGAHRRQRCIHSFPLCAAERPPREPRAEGRVTEQADRAGGRKGRGVGGCIFRVFKSLRVSPVKVVVGCQPRRGGASEGGRGRSAGESRLLRYRGANQRPPAHPRLWRSFLIW